ncbi:hypothetical protein R4282_15835 [Rhodococcus oxybenzonivorans]|uniref:hypothetical protein n=1 Tax=Rhodococcus oxybenzonivorans TaxID=1990687 RepID=UPI0029549406|nr:hypothetical protein [Rhodococcus oxybenzonivorans]MDV7354472.1 hypothetical protein [Rhodococcus oxybenzonivorans]
MTPLTRRARRSLGTGAAIALGGVFFVACMAIAGLPQLSILVGAALVFGVSIRHPQFGLVVWLLSICYLPFWFGLSKPMYLPPTSIIALLLLGAIFTRNRWILNRFDLCVLLFAVLSIAAGLTGMSRPGDVTNVVTQWVLSFLVGRLLIQRVGFDATFRIVTVLFASVGAFAVLEFFFDWNPYYEMVADNTQYLAWGRPQERGGIIRAEWAFGHSIALGCSLGMAIPIALSSSFRPAVRIVCASLLLAGTVVTFSRAGLVTALLSIVIYVLFAPSSRHRRGALPLVAVCGVAIMYFAPKVLAIYTAKGTKVSAEYRADLSQLIPSFNLLGLANGYLEPSPGVYYFEGFKSIDSTFILLGLSFGIIPLTIILIGAVAIVIRVLRREGTPAMIALASVFPALFTVALITQFGSLVWFYVGLAALTWTARANTDSTATSEAVEST